MGIVFASINFVLGNQGSGSIFSANISGKENIINLNGIRFPRIVVEYEKKKLSLKLEKVKEGAAIIMNGHIDPARIVTEYFRSY